MQVNKPYLPLASGEFTMATAVAIVSVCGALAVVLGSMVGSPPLMATLLGSALLGVVYSVDLPFLRWKQNPVASAACILAVRCTTFFGEGKGTPSVTEGRKAFCCNGKEKGYCAIYVACQAKSVTVGNMDAMYVR